MSRLDRLLVLLVLGGLSINLLLLYRKLADGAFDIAGCSGGGCDAVLGSRWGLVMGIPVSALGALIDVVILLGLFLKRNTYLTASYACLIGAGFWFTFVQAVLIRQWCPWCMGLHGLGWIIAIGGLISLRAAPFSWSGLQAGVFATLSLALIQVYGPAPSGFRMETPTRSISFAGGHRSYDANSLPRLGTANAPHVMVEYFDYRCPACRKMSGYLEALIRKHPQQVAVLLLPVPLERSCNAAMPAADEEHPGSCELARLALAVWKEKPEEFPSFHASLLAEPAIGVKAARESAAAILGGAKLDVALQDSAISEMLAAHVLDWTVLSTTTRKLPKLIVRDRRILHGLPSNEADFVRVMEQELGL
jgi:uncharacterized membrane protein